MNKRKAKKAEQKLHLVGGNYRKEREYLRKCHEEYIADCRKYRKKGIIPEDLANMIELGLYTKDEVRRFLTWRKRKQVKKNENIKQEKSR